MTTIQDIERMAKEAAREPTMGDEFLDGLYRRCSSWGWKNVRSPYYLFLFLLAQHLRDGRSKPQYMVELGTAQGLGFVLMGAGNPEGVALGVDWRLPALYVKALAHGIPNIQLWMMGTVEAGEEFRRRGLRPEVRLIFVDSTHTRDHANAELSSWFPSFAEECILVADDIKDAANNTDLTGWWRDDVPGEKILFPDVLHCPDNVIGVSIIRR